MANFKQSPKFDRSEKSTSLSAKKIRVGILGSGNIGSDLLSKILRSDLLTCSLFVGQRADSEGLARAATLGVPWSCDSIRAFIKHKDVYDIVFDATTAQSHLKHAAILAKLGKFTIDLTPSKIGLMCVPILNLDQGLSVANVNMISCGGQANAPLISAMRDVHKDIEYAEIVSSISSRSAGIGTRNNIDEYTQTTSDGIMALTGVARAKTIINLNPAIPPIHMHNTIYLKINKPDMKQLASAVTTMVKKIQQYVPGYKLLFGPVYENNRVTVINEVVGLGDYLPVYAGNLDIINCAAMAVAEAWAKRKLSSNARL